MPLCIDRILPQDARLLVWNLSETEGAMEMFIEEEEKLSIQRQFRLEERRKQKMAMACLSKLALGSQYAEIQYNKLGKPLLPDKTGHVSFSHCAEYVGLLYHPCRPIGLDLEKLDGRAARIYSRFTNRMELGWADLSSDSWHSTLIWSVKEAIFKLIGGGGILFREMITVEKPNTEIQCGKVTFSTSLQTQVFDYHYFFLDEVIMVHTIAPEKMMKEQRL
jgi:4'-phosphopantetheinyl transferase